MVVTTDGLDILEAQLGALDRTSIRRIVEAGATAAQEDWRSSIRQARHIRTGAMLESVGATPYKETLGGGQQSVYPLGDDSRGTPNALKAYVINYGRGKRGHVGKMGDRFITSREAQTEERVHEAMQAESDRILDEINR